jgi:hypothetical protein
MLLLIFGITLVVHPPTLSEDQHHQSGTRCGQHKGNTPPDALPVRDTQEQLLSCKKLKQTKHTVVSEKIVIDNIYGTVSPQKAVVTLVKENLQERNKLLNSNPTSGCDHWTLAPPGAMQAQLDICNDNCSVCIGN